MNIENENNILQYIANTNYAELLIFYQKDLTSYYQNNIIVIS